MMSPGALPTRGGLSLRRLALLLMLFLVVPASADETCWTTTTPTATVPDPSGAAGDVYVIARNVVGCGATCMMDLWVYQESNGLPGLQREDAFVDDVERCEDGTHGDTVVF